MKKIVIPSAGGYDKLVLQEFTSSLAAPSANEVQIQVRFAGVNYADCLIRLGVYASAKEYVGWPITPGFEVSGTVIRVGESVQNFKPGDLVGGFTLFNGYSSEINIVESQVFHLPSGFTLEECAAFPAVFMTAYYALFQIIHIHKSGTILVHSAAGGVGSALVQLASQAKMKVIGVVGSRHKMEYVQSLGAEKVYDKSRSDFSWSEIAKDHPKKFDAVFDANGFTTFTASYQLLRPTGKLVVFGSHSLIPKSGGRLNYLKAAWGLLRTPKFSPMDLITENKTVAGFNLSFLFTEQEMMQENLKGLLQLFANKQIKPPKVRVFPAEKVAEAHAHIESGQSVGKIVLEF